MVSVSADPAEPTAREAALLAEIDLLRRQIAANSGAHREALADSLEELASSEALNAALHASESRLRLVLESATDVAIIATDVAGRVTNWNTGACNVLGWNADEMLGRTTAVIWTAEDIEAGALDIEMRLTREEGRATDERWHVKRDGSIFWASGEMMPLRGSSDQLLGYLKILRDSTAQHEEQQRLKADLTDAQNFMRLALSSIGGVGAWTYDPASDQFFCNPTIAKLYGLDVDRAAAGVSSHEFLANVHPEDLSRLRSTMDRGLEQPGDLEQEYRINHPDGSIRYVLSRGHTYHEHGNPVRRVGIGIELTKQRLLEEQLRQSQKMEAVGQLTGGIAHDFNNLLTGITGALDIMQRRIGQGRTADVERYIGLAMTSANRAASLTHRLLAFSRRQSLDPKPTDGNHLVNAMADLLRRTLGESVTLRTVLLPRLWTILCDPHQLENAILNLCINARDAMPDGGALTIRTNNTVLDAGAAQARDMPPGQYITFSVSDTGTGMTPDVMARAFDPFFTTKPIGQGTGLGLSMIYGFVRQSGGQVRIHSEIGQGTTINLHLPRHLGEAELVDDRQAVAPPRGTVGETVLIIDDDPTVRTLVAEVLGELGYAALEAADGPSGLAVLRSGTRIDLLITDVGLPGGMNGRQVADAARALRAGLKVLFITGYAENAAVGNGDMEPGMHLLTKPFPMDVLAFKIRAIIGNA